MSGTTPQEAQAMHKNNPKMSTGQFRSFAGAVIDALPDDIDPQIVEGWKNDRAALRQALRAALVPEALQETPDHPTVYPFTVDYGLTVEDLVKQGKYDWVNSDLNSKHFPVPEDQGKDAKVEEEGELVHYGKDMSTEAALADIDARGYRPANARELLAFGAKFPNVQREFPVIALGQAWQSSGGSRFVAYLHGSGSERGASLSDVGSGWHDYCRFLVFRK